MTRSRPFVLLAVSLGIILLSSFAASAQSPKRKRGAAKQTVIAVKEINTDSLKSLLKRESAQPRPLLVNFWATWCDPCRDEFPDLVQIDKQYRPKGLDFIAVSLDDLADINTEVPKFLRQMRASMPAYLLNVPDPEMAINAVDPKWSGALPATFLYDAQGVVVFKHFGRVNPAELRAAIEKLVDNKVVMSNK
ncbi:MAG: redoxin domain-containing protein [Pyrinomonadaceae bacterium]